MSRRFTAKYVAISLSALVSVSMLAACTGNDRTTETVRGEQAKLSVEPTRPTETSDAPEKPSVDDPNGEVDEDTETTQPSSTSTSTADGNGADPNGSSPSGDNSSTNGGGSTAGGEGSGGSTSRPSIKAPRKTPTKPKQTTGPKAPATPKTPTKPKNTTKPKSPAKPGKPKPIPLSEPMPEFTYIMDCTNTAMNKKPRTFNANCGSRRIELANVVWSSWGKTSATARGRVAYWRGKEAPDMDYAVSITATGLADKTSGRRYTKVTIRHGKDRPEGIAAVKTYILP